MPRAAARKTAMPPLCLTDAGRRALTGWAADCARRALGVFEETVHGDPRPRGSIEAAKAYAQGAPRDAALRAHAWGALRAAKLAPPAAAAAARAACYASGAAYIHDQATANQCKHVVGPAAAAALALDLAAGDAAGALEVQWAVRRAPRAVLDLVTQLPPPPRGRSPLALWMGRVDEGLRSRDGPG